MWFIREDDNGTMYLDIVFCKYCKYCNGVNTWCDYDIHVNDDYDYCSKGVSIEEAGAIENGEL